MGGGDKRGGGETKRKKERQGWERDKVGGGTHVASEGWYAGIIQNSNCSLGLLAFLYLDFHFVEILLGLGQFMQ